jgi:organic radical activating enzyme
MIYLVEHFYSFQGEGLYSGSPTIFIRLGGCNLNCQGFGVETISPLDGSTLIGCDSQKAVNDKHFKATWQAVDSDKLIEIVDGYFNEHGYIADMVITGGEPLIHYQNLALIELLEHLKFKGSRVTFETNATIAIDFDNYPIYKDPLYSMSVKLSNSGEAYEKRINPEAIRAIITHASNHYFKFVVDKEYIETNGNQEIRSITMMHPQSPIYCMPKGASTTELAKHDESVAEFCKQNNYIFSDRTHIRIYNRRDGV